MRNNKLTRRQSEILRAIGEYIKIHGYAPSFREIAEIVNLASVSTVYGHLENLKRKGYISWEPTQPRTLQIIKAA